MFYPGMLLMSTAFGSLLNALLQRSGPLIAEPVSQATKEQGSNTMSSMDIIGALFDDDDDVEGTIGALFDDDDDEVSGNEELLAALVSGMGDSEIVGSTADLLVGAKGRRAIKRAKAKRLVKAVASRNAGAVVKTGVDKRRRYPLGFLPTSVPGGATSNIPAAPQNLYRAERLVIPSDIGFDFGITDIKVGNQSQFVQNIEVPGALFSEVAIDTAVHFDTAEVGNQISLSARNKTAAAIEFTAAFVGTVAK